MLRVRTVFTGESGAPWLNTLYFDGNDLAAAQAGANAAKAFWGGIGNVIAGGVHIQVQHEVAVINPITGDQENEFTVAATPDEGSGSTDPLPFQTQLGVKLRTPVFTGGRRLQGRIYIPGLPLTQSANGIPLLSAVGAVQAKATTLVNTGILHVWSRTHGVEGVVSTASVDSTKFWTLRSRRD